MHPDKHGLMVRDYPLEERPRERMIREGAEALSKSRVASHFLRTGTHRESVLQLASRLLKEIGSIRRLYDISIDELMQIKGIGQARPFRLRQALNWDDGWLRKPRSRRLFVHPKMQPLI